MRTSTIRRVSLATVVCATVIATAVGCSSGPTAKEDFAGDLKAMGYHLKGDITFDKEEKKSSLGLAPMAFELSASSQPKKSSGSNGDSSTASSEPKVDYPTPAATKTPQTITILEAIVNVGGCDVELERFETDTSPIKTVGKAKIQDFWVDEVNGQDALGAPTGAPRVNTVEAYLAAKNYPCFTG